MIGKEYMRTELMSLLEVVKNVLQMFIYGGGIIRESGIT
jgi:hypothetical protein